VSKAVTTFVQAGKAAAPENQDLNSALIAACHDAVKAGESLNLSIGSESESDDDMRKTQLVTSSWDTVTSVIQILMLADQAAVSEVTHANEMVVEGLTRLESCQNFHEFMREFTEFGRRMINLAHYTGARQKDLKSDVARAYISATRFELEKGTAVLLTSSKVYFRHPSSNLARAFRDNCFTNMRSVLARMANICLTEKVKKNDDTKYISAFSLLDNLKLTVSSCHNSASLPSYNDVTGSLRHSSSFGSRIERISKQLFLFAQIMERALEFTDSPFCGHEQRSDILRRDLEVCNAAVARIVGISNDLSSTGLYRRNFNVEALIENLTELSKCLSLNIANDTTKAVAALTEFSKQVSSPRVVSVCFSNRFVHHYMAFFKTNFAQIQEACRLAQQCHVDPSHIVSIKHVCEFIEGLTQQFNSMLFKSTLLYKAASLNGSPVAVENFTALIGQWHSVASSEISSMQTNLSSVARKASGGKSPSPVHDTIARSGNIYQRLDTSEQTVAARLGLEIKLLSAQCHVECQHWRDVEGASVALIENFESVASSSKHIYLFTRGEPPLHTTADFFNTAIDTSSYASRMYTIFGWFQYRTGGSYLRSDVLSACAQLPNTCQRLSATAKTAAHGKSSVFSKVMMTLRDVRATLELVSKL
uniref:Alpha-catulin n=1 Tax=Ciona intestinalis TaxID=7719 RepID=F6Y9W9_CIOIN